MGLDDLQNIARETSKRKGATDTIAALSSTDDSGFWKELVNLRLKNNDGFLQWVRRGGVSLLADLPGLSSAIVTFKGFETVYSNTIKRFLVIHTANGDCHIYDNDSEVFTTIVDTDNGGIPFSETQPLYLIVNGRLLYLFDPDTQRNRVYNLETEQLSDWMQQGGVVNLAPNPLHSANSGPFPEKNVWGFAVGRRAIGLPFGTIGNSSLVQDELSIRRDLVRYSEIPLWIGYINSDGEKEHLLFTDGTEISENGLYFKPIGAGVQYDSTKGSNGIVSLGDLPSVRFLRNLPASFLPEQFITPRSAGVPEDVFKARTVNITGFKTISGDSSPNKEYIAIEDEGTESFTAKNTGYERLMYPETISLDRLRAQPMPFTVTGDGRLTANPDYAAPKLYRGYALVHVLADGSVTLPGRPQLIEVDMETVKDESVSAIRLSIEAATQDIDYRYLISTRWQLSEEEVFAPSSPDNPAGNWFVHTRIDNDFHGDFLDDKDDTLLVQPLSALVPLVAGVPVQFAPGELLPGGVAQQGGSLLFYNYGIRPQVPTVNKNYEFKSGLLTGGTASDVRIYLQYEYTSGRASELVALPDIAEETAVERRFSVRFFGFNALISKAVIYAKKPNDDDYRLVASATPITGLFAGAEYTRGAGTATSWYNNLENGTPSTRTNREVQIQNFIGFAAPIQQPDIRNQVAIADASAIKAVEPWLYDSDKTEMRLQLIVQTKENLQTGYITEQSEGNRTVFDGQFEILDASLGSPDGYGMKRVGDSLYMSGIYGIYRLEMGKGIRLIASKDRYAAAGLPLFSVEPCTEHGEVWLHVKGDELVHELFVYRDEGITRYRFFEDAEGFGLQGIARINKQLYIAAGNVVGEADTTNINDMGTAIKATAETASLTNALEQVRLLQLRVAGQQALCTAAVDTQRPRRQGSGLNWQAAFIDNKLSPEKPLSISESVFDMYRQAMQMRVKLRFRFTNISGFIEHIIMRGRGLASKNKAKEV